MELATSILGSGAGEREIANGQGDS